MTKSMRLKVFLDTVRDGDDHGWMTEVGHLLQDHQDCMTDLIDDIRVAGMTTPIDIGPDGRCWDGHHRVAAAIWLGLDRVPVKDARGATP